MNTKSNIPGPQMDENDAARLVATYGKKPDPGKWREIQASLQAQKENFLSQTRTREKNGKDRQG